jgi:eukaryotic-like serine/threonine-protein kinase
VVDAAPAQVLADGRLRLTRLLGEGGMGRVFEAYDRSLRAPVALKMLRKTTVDAVVRLKTEFRALQEVRHPNLVRLGQLFVARDACFFTMELIDGVSFLDHVCAGAVARRPRRTDPTLTGGASTRANVHDADDEDRTVWDADTLRLEVLFDEAKLRGAVRQLAEGLDALHRAGKVHRDVKPSNALVTGDGRLVLLDLGLSIDVGAATPTGTIEGTIEYMAPEQVTGAVAAAPADMYATGAVLYEALTGRPPFLGDSLQVLRDKQEVDPVAPTVMFPGIPADLEELCMALLRRDPTRRPTAREVADGIGDTRRAWRPGGVRKSPAPARFVGRREPLAELHRALADSASRAVAVVVTGESGIGKSALLRRFAHEVGAAPARHALLFSGRCHAQESVPFRAFDGIADAVSRYVVSLPAAEREAILPRDAPALSRLFPVFERLAPPDAGGDASGIDVRARRRRAFAVLRQLLGNLARRGPIALVVDDLQWIDSDSLQLLEGVFALQAPPLLLIGMMRPTPEIVASLRRTLAPAAIEIRELALGPLTDLEGAELARALLADHASPEAVVQVSQQSRGNPLYLEEMATAVAHGRSCHDSLERLLWERVHDLGDDERIVLDLACVAALALDQATLARAAGLTRQELAAALARLEEVRLIRTTGARRNDLAEPYHDQVRVAVRGLMTPETVRRRHGTLAEALERRNAPPWMTFHHWLSAGQPAKAAPHAVAAAMKAQRELSARRVARLCEAALGLLPDGHEARGQLCRALAVALGNAGQGADAARWYLTAAAATDGVEAIELRRRAADHLLRCGRIDDGLAIFRDLLAAVGVDMPRTPGRALAKLMWRRARMQVRRRRTAPPPQLDASARLRADVCMSIGVSLAMVDTVTAASLHAVGALEAMRLGDRERLARALATEAGYAATRGLAGAARAARMLDEADRAARESGSAVAAGIVLWSRGIAAYVEGRYRDALDACDVAVRHFAERCPGHVWEHASAELFAAWSLCHLGRLDEAHRRLDDLAQAARWNDDRYTATLIPLGNCVLVPLAADDLTGARAQIDDAMAGWSRAGFHLQHALELAARTELDLYLGDGASAWRRLEAARPALVGSLRLKMQHTRIWVGDMRARAAIASGDPALRDAARDLARRILREQVPWAAGLARCRLAAVADAAGRRDEARRLLVQAIGECEAADLALHAAAHRLRLAWLDGAAVEDAPAWHAMTAAGVVRPDRWMAMYAPW